MCSLSICTCKAVDIWVLFLLLRFFFSRVLSDREDARVRPFFLDGGGILGPRKCNLTRRGVDEFGVDGRERFVL